MTFYVITFCNNCDFLCHFDLPKHDSLWQKWVIWITGNPHILYLYFHYLISLFYLYFDHLFRWWSWRTSSLTAQALCWCLSTCCQICRKSFGIPSVLSPHPRSKVTCWCCWKEWLSVTRTPSCTGWDCVPVMPLHLSFTVICPRLSSHCRLKWPKSDFFAQMWPISDFLMTVWTAQIRFFQIRARPLSYVVLNWIHIWCFAMRLQSERPCRISCDFYVIEMRQTSQFCAGGGGKIKITMADNI